MLRGCEEAMECMCEETVVHISAGGESLFSLLRVRWLRTGRDMRRGPWDSVAWGRIPKTLLWTRRASLEVEVTEVVSFWERHAYALKICMVSSTRLAPMMM